VNSLAPCVRVLFHVFFVLIELIYILKKKGGGGGGGGGGVGEGKKNMYIVFIWPVYQIV
jgi:hypothetical protein